MFRSSIWSSSGSSLFTSLSMLLILKIIKIFIKYYHPSWLCGSICFKKKVKGRFLELFNTAAIFGLLYSYSHQVPAFISRGATRHTDARDLYQRRRELLPMNFASKFLIYVNLLGSFTCRKAWTWDRFFYSPLKESILSAS